MLFKRLLTLLLAATMVSSSATAASAALDIGVGIGGVGVGINVGDDLGVDVGVEADLPLGVDVSVGLTVDGNLPPLYPLDTLPPSPGDNAAVQWNEEALECIRDVAPGPTVVARSLAVVHTAMYDAWAAYDARAVGTRLGGSLRRPAIERNVLNKSRAVSHAAYMALRDQFPTCQESFLERLLALGYTELDPTGAAVVGRTAARAVLEFRHNDGSNQLGGYADTTGYQPVNTPDAISDPWRWQPLRHPTDSGQTIVQRGLTPQWGAVIPFALTGPDQFRPPGPSRDPAATADDVLRESAELDDRQKVTGEYWADGPRSELPPGHWNLFAQWVARRDRRSLDDSVKLFFALNGAMLDASIAAWRAKYEWDFARPITVIRALRAGQAVTAWRGPYQGRGTMPGETWRPYQKETFPTPPFPEYVSGHSTFSAAAARILRTFTGSDAFGASTTIRAGTSFVEPRTSTHPGVPATDVRLSWATFTAAADEAGVSRRYGGIHFIDADLHGRSMGDAIGRQAWTRGQSYWSP